MKYVLDSNVAVKWYLPEADSTKALKLRADFQGSILELLAPDILPIEFGHAMTRTERQGIIAPGDADLHYVDLLTVGLPLDSSQPILRRAIAISSSARIGVYDCLYVAPAEREGCEMVTADDRLLKNLQPQFPFIRALGSMP